MKKLGKVQHWPRKKRSIEETRGFRTNSCLVRRKFSLEAPFCRILASKPRSLKHAIARGIHVFYVSPPTAVSVATDCTP